MRSIFISYRREDAEGEAGRLFDDLVEHFGEDAVFMDVTAIAPGRDFRRAIDESVATCGVLLAVIGQNWAEAKNAAGQRRLDDPTDFVRLETAAALKRDIPVVPVLIRGARMPRPEQLPDDVKDLAYRSAVELTHARWASDVQLLLRALRPLVPDLSADGAAAQKSPSPRPATSAPVDVGPSRGSRPVGTGVGDRQPGAAGGIGPGSLPSRLRQMKWLAVAGALLVVLGVAGYGAYSSFTGDRAKQQAMDQQRRAAEDEAAKRRPDTERAEFAQKVADLERDAAKFASDKAAAEKATADKAAAAKAAADKAEADRRREAAEARRAAADKAAAEKAAADRAAADRAEAERRREAAEAQRRAADEKAAADKGAADRAEAEKAAALRLASEQAEAERAAAKKAADERAAAEKAETAKAETPVRRAEERAVNTVSFVALEPPSHSRTLPNRDVKVSFSYSTTEPGGVRIFVRPLVGASPAPNYSASGSPLFPTGRGTGEANFTIRSGNVTVDGIRIQMQSADQSKLLFEAILPVRYEFRVFFPGIR